MPRLSYDLHIHSCLSPCGDNENTPYNIAGMAVVKGLQVIALTDHNSSKNCGVFLRACEEYGVIGIPGMELTTSEEVHALCLFPDLEKAMKFDSYVHERILPIENKAEIFGNQFIIGDDDEPVGEEKTLLISATDISLDELYELVREYGGLMIPAHIDKTSDSIFSNLGFMPEEVPYKTVEMVHPEKLEEYLFLNPVLEGMKLIKDSDAHYLENISEPENFLEVEEESALGVLKALGLQTVK